RRGAAPRRELGAHVRGPQLALDVVHADAQELLVAEAAQDVELRLVVLSRAQPGAELPREVVARPLDPYEIGTHQAVEELGMAQEEAGEELAGREEADQQPHDPRVLEQPEEIARARPDRG